jgi:Carbohydrate family 9 binding domain-like/Surface glycan-binding protein B xyloglucan binding domain
MMIRSTILALAVLALHGCTQVKPLALYDSEDYPNHGPLKGLNASVIYDEALSTEVWFTQNTSCIQVAPETGTASHGSNSMRINWDKPGGGCDWVGMGIGWAGWSGKDFSQILTNAAIVFEVRSQTGPMKGLPWAIGFEDFNGEQAWTGFAPSMIEGKVITDQWTTVRVPLENFPFEAREVDATAIKQVIMQFESSGTVSMDNIRIEPYKSRGRQEAILRTIDGISFDGAINIADSAMQIFELEGHKLFIGSNQDFLFLGGVIFDESPLINTREGKDIWNGDGVEIAFSTRSGLNPKRSIFYADDRHLGIRLSNSPQIWDWTRSQVVNAEVKTIRVSDRMYSFECMIPWKELSTEPWQEGGEYALEIAVDLADKESVRQSQIRWNSIDKEGFHTTPSLWGRLFIQPSTR